MAQVPGLCASNPLAAILFCKLLARPSLHGDHFLIEFQELYLLQLLQILVFLFEKLTFLLQKPGTDEGIAVIIWDKIDDMEANKSEAHELLLKSMAPLFAKPPVTDFYEVCSEIEGSPI